MNKSDKLDLVSIDFLIFTAGKWLFGVDVEQVKQIMKGLEISSDTISFEGEDVPVSPFLGAYRINEKEEYSTENVIVVRAENGYSALAVDNIENIITLFPGTHISPLPPLVEAKKELSCLWGMARKEDDLVLLVNIDQL